MTLYLSLGGQARFDGGKILGRTDEINGGTNLVLQGLRHYAIHIHLSLRNQLREVRIDGTR